MSSVSDATARVQAAQQQVQSIQNAIVHAPTLAQTNALDVELRNAYADLDEARKALAIAQKAAGVANPILGQGLMDGGSAVINYPGTPALSSAQKIERAAFAGAFGLTQLNQFNGSVNNFTSSPTNSNSGLTERFNAIQVTSPDSGPYTDSTNPNPGTNPSAPVNWSLSPPPASDQTPYVRSAPNYYQPANSSTDYMYESSSDKSDGTKSHSRNETDPEEESEKSESSHASQSQEEDDDDRASSSHADSKSQVSQSEEEEDDDRTATSESSSNKSEEEEEDDSSQSSTSQSRFHYERKEKSTSSYSYTPQRTVTTTTTTATAPPPPKAHTPEPLTFHNAKVGLRINLKLLSGRMVTVTITQIIMGRTGDFKNITVMLDGKPYIFAVYLHPTGGGTQAWLA